MSVQNLEVTEDEVTANGDARLPWRREEERERTRIAVETMIETNGKKKDKVSILI